MSSPFSYSLEASSDAGRAGVLRTPHGPIPTPAFMPVGTLGTVKAVSPHELREVGASMILGNAYHLYLRPGAEAVRELGGLHEFMRWDGPILTDSGGFQVFSLGSSNDIDDDGVVFRSHIDGSRHHFTPESVMDLERALGADVIMAFDECPPGGVDRQGALRANRRTLAWLDRCKRRFDQTSEGVVSPQALFPVLQGNIFDDLRRDHALDVQAMGDWVGYGIGGLSVGEAKPDMWRILEVLHDVLPTNRPRYLMGVGYPDDLLEAISRGCDMFDCVAPTRNARHGTAWTAEEGQVNLKAARFRLDRNPIDSGCDCYACAHFDRAYIRHLLVCGERLAHRLISIHNLRFLIRLTEQARLRIEDGTFKMWSVDWLERYRSARANAPKPA